MKRKTVVILLCLLLSLALTVTVYAAGPRIVDEADLLTLEQEQSLEQTAEEFRSTYDLDAVVLTVNSLGGKSIAAYADDYYDHQGYGIGPEYSGLILVVDMGSRQLYISTCGDAIDRLSDRELDDIIENVSFELSSGNYYDAFTLYFGFAALNLDYDGGSVSREDAGISWLLSMLVGLLGAGISVAVMAGSMNTKRKQQHAADYVKTGSYDLKNRQDIFLYSNISKIKREQNSGSHGGGTSVHRSSSGRSHGGRGGRF